MAHQKARIHLTGVYLSDPEDNSITGFFSEVPEAVAQGDSLEEVEQKLFDILPDLFEIKKQMIEEEALINGTSALVQTKSYEFEPA